MKRTNPSVKIAKKRDVLAARTAKILNMDIETALEKLRTERHQSIRINPLAGTEKETLQKMQALGWRGEKCPWAEYGFTVETGLEALRDSELAMDGSTIIQNAASWLPVLALDPKPNETILDVCAAPGGKTSHIAALANNKAHITANDNSRARQAKLRAMCERMRANVERFTLFDGQYLARKLEGEQFDKILLDAPCSGEGLIRFDSDKDMATWSVAHIKRLQHLQKRLVHQAWQLLKPGGTLVYSTCTMAPEENEVVVDYALRRLEDISLVPLTVDLPNRVPIVSGWEKKEFDTRVEGCIRLQPSPNIEAFFVCKLLKQQ